MSGKERQFISALYRLKLCIEWLDSVSRQSHTLRRQSKYNYWGSWCRWMAYPLMNYYSNFPPDWVDSQPTYDSHFCVICATCSLEILFRWIGEKTDISMVGSLFGWKWRQTTERHFYDWSKIRRGMTISHTFNLFLSIPIKRFSYFIVISRVGVSTLIQTARDGESVEHNWREAKSASEQNVFHQIKRFSRIDLFYFKRYENNLPFRWKTISRFTIWRLRPCLPLSVLSACRKLFASSIVSTLMDLLSH